jgi:hypothetical protein
MDFNGNDFNMSEDDYQYGGNFSSRKGKKSFKKKKTNDDFERGFGNNKKRNKPKRGNKDYDDY